jgi:hypothetical protein
MQYMFFHFPIALKPDQVMATRAGTHRESPLHILHDKISQPILQRSLFTSLSISDLHTRFASSSNPRLLHPLPGLALGFFQVREL